MRRMLQIWDSNDKIKEHIAMIFNNNEPDMIYHNLAGFIPIKDQLKPIFKHLVDTQIPDSY